MSIKSRTIDNLGIESSIRYAKDKELLDTRLIDESKWVPNKTEVSVTRPYVPSEFDQLFSLGRTIQWALFDPPPNFEAHTRALFSYQLIPSLGSYEKQEADTDKLAALEPQGLGPQEKKEWETLVKFLKTVGSLDKMLGMINGRLNQYHRG